MSEESDALITRIAGANCTYGEADQLRDEITRIEREHPCTRDLCEALGWQGGTIHGVLAEIKRLRFINAEFSHLNFCEITFSAHVRKLFVKPTDSMGRSVHAVMGLSGEAGELIDAIKKAWIYGKVLDRENVLEECGDALFYLVALMNEQGFTLADAANHNYAKLSKRYPEGFTEKAAQERADKK